MEAERVAGGMCYFPAMTLVFPEPGHLLFAYGSLMLETGHAEVDAVMRNAATLTGRGYIHGYLFDLGAYPGAVPAAPDRDGRAPKVWGNLLRLDRPEAVFAVLDAYEGFDARLPAASEFVRAVADVFMPEREGGIASQVYFYNLPVRDRAPIASGDYLAFRGLRGLQG